MIVVPRPRSRKGGVAVLLCEPLSGFMLTVEQSEWGQLLAVEVLGADRPLTVVCCYRHKLPGLAAAAAVMTALRSLRDKTWVVAADWNEAVSTKGQWSGCSPGMLASPTTEGRRRREERTQKRRGSLVSLTPSKACASQQHGRLREKANGKRISRSQPSGRPGLGAPKGPSRRQASWSAPPKSRGAPRHRSGWRPAASQRANRWRSAV